MDTLTVEKRSELMSRIRSRDTKPELAIKKWLWASGYRYARKDHRLPGRPDVVLPKYHTVIFVQGCFWHGHDCRIGGLPKSNLGYWQPKIQRNKARDIRNIRKLRKMGWHCFQIWECKLLSDFNRVAARLGAIKKTVSTHG
ncbi:very short patch repair endonuclease [Keguizhuia sedimenti]|uniref:very short patch repair endonuclease n=1 Tax=Keguizhuia sedimenti TaxID=3064264 RepID=UPI003BB151AE